MKTEKKKTKTKQIAIESTSGVYKYILAIKYINKQLISPGFTEEQKLANKSKKKYARTKKTTTTKSKSDNLINGYKLTHNRLVVYPGSIKLD